MVATRNRAAVAEEELSEPLPARLVQDMHAVFGEHHARAVNTKGMIVRGGFAPSAEARELCRAQLFRESMVPVVARFSNFAGFPNIADNASLANPRGFAVKFLISDGSNLDIVNHSVNDFPVSSITELSELMQAAARSGGQPTPGSELDVFFENNPRVKNFLTKPTRAPRSWATISYYSINAVQFTNQRGENCFVRYQFVPAAGEQIVPIEEEGRLSPDYLFEEISERLAAGPVRFTWYAQVAEDSDAIDDPATAWPDDRRRVPLGTITIDQLGPNSPEADRALVFLPGSLPPGIEVADPMLTFRNAAYPYSFAERNR
ncbi:catalase [Micromonospora rhizosphaerae]|uniref:Catalase-related peroxidase n=1 Tax=Micromonospora rhizosphaerae TaxID=568872 RepID=A0A1C6REP7_9ACTN|nr:catalase [Micromonospora rhizosphaerae]SCL15553.1 catalase [Micromonospora rhizosphaerae]